MDENSVKKLVKKTFGQKFIPLKIMNLLTWKSLIANDSGFPSVVSRQNNLVKF
jgi:hypothetical protein